MTHVFDFLGSEWSLYFAMFQAYLLIMLVFGCQSVSGCCVTCLFQVYLWYLSFICPLVCKWQSHLAHYKSAYDAYCQLLACEQLAFHISSLLTAHIHGSLGSKWLSYLTFQACWQCCLSRMWGCCILWYFKPAYNSGSWLSSLWVVAIPCCISSFVYNTCLYLSLWVAAIPFFSSYKPVYFMTLQLVSGCHLIPKLAYNASSWFGRMWVVALSPCILSLLIMHS